MSTAELRNRLIEKIKKTEAPVIGDVKEVLNLLTPLVKKGDFTGWKNEFRKLEPKEKEAVTDRDLKFEGQIKMAEVVKMVSDKTKAPLHSTAVSRSLSVITVV